MSFFKKLGRDSKKLFRKAQRGVHSLSGKAEKGLGEASRIARVGQTILDNPVTEGLATAALGPEAGLAVAAAGEGLGELSRVTAKAKDVARQTKEFSDPAKTRDRVANPRDTLERAKKIGRDAKGVVDDDFFRPRDRSVGDFMPRRQGGSVVL